MTNKLFSIEQIIKRGCRHAIQHTADYIHDNTRYFICINNKLNEDNER